MLKRAPAHREEGSWKYKVGTLPTWRGVELHTTLDGESINVYVVTGVTDLNAIAEIVPARKSRSERTYTQPMSTILIMRKTRSTRSWKI